MKLKIKDIEIYYLENEFLIILKTTSLNFESLLKEKKIKNIDIFIYNSPWLKDNTIDITYNTIDDITNNIIDDKFMN